MVKDNPMSYIEPEIRTEAEGILNNLGMTTADAISIFLSQVIIKGGLPFEVKLPEPNDITIEAMKESEAIANSGAHRFKNADEMFKELGI